MYTDFYALRERPFSLTPSPRFLYLGEEHKEALAFLTYGVMERKGFILLTGEVGTGKTTMVQALLKNLDSSVKHIYLSNPILTPEEFRQYLAALVFPKNTKIESKADFIIKFEEFLQYCLREQKIFLLIIDESQTLSFELLEEIRLLSNMESADEKLINIFLVGQPELNQKLLETRCRPLLQRISIRYHIPPLDMDSTRNYIFTRLKVAGAMKADRIFSKGAIKSIHNYSNGYPRMINTLANNSMLLGYSLEKFQVSSSMIKQVYEELQLEGSILTPSKNRTEKRIRGGKTSTIWFNPWKWSTLLLIIMIGAAFIMFSGLEPFSGKIIKIDVSDQILQYLPDNDTNQQNQEIEKAETDTPEIEKAEPDIPEREINDRELAVNQISHKKQLLKEIIEESGSINAHNQQETDYFDEPSSSDSKTVMVQKGDTLSELVSKIYGWFDANLVNYVLQYNPSIKDNNIIEPGTSIVFYPLPEDIKVNLYTVHIATFKSLEYAHDLFQDMIKDGHEVYIIPDHNILQEMVSKITLGKFRSYAKAKKYANMILKKNISDYAKTIPLEIQ